MISQRIINMHRPVININYIFIPGYPPTNRTGVSSRKRPSPPVQCCDQTYAKSKQGIFKIILLILSNIAWICVACTPYIKVSFSFR